MQVASNIYDCYPITSLNWTPEYRMVRCRFKNKHLKDMCLKEIGQCLWIS